MKISLELHPRRPLNRSEAWGCFIANLALPGSGSLVAGRRVGYAQMALAVLALVLSLVTTVPAIVWMINHWSQFGQDNGDPLGNLLQLWKVLRAPLFSLGLFLISIIWAGISSLQILAASPKTPHA